MLFYVMQGVICVVIPDWLCHNQLALYNSWIGVVIVCVAYIVLIVPTCLIVDRIKENKNHE